MNLQNITSIEVKAEVRQIKSSWTREMAQDISMYHSIDVEKELGRHMKREIRIAKIKRIITYQK